MRDRSGHRGLRDEVLGTRVRRQTALKVSDEVYTGAYSADASLVAVALFTAPTFSILTSSSTPTSPSEHDRFLDRPKLDSDLVRPQELVHLGRGVRGPAQVALAALSGRDIIPTWRSESSEFCRNTPLSPDDSWMSLAFAEKSTISGLVVSEQCLQS
jgi:hypothetical protein